MYPQLMQVVCLTIHNIVMPFPSLPGSPGRPITLVLSLFQLLLIHSTALYVIHSHYIWLSTTLVKMLQQIIVCGPGNCRIEPIHFLAGWHKKPKYGI